MRRLECDGGGDEQVPVRERVPVEGGDAEEEGREHEVHEVWRVVSHLFVEGRS